MIAKVENTPRRFLGTGTPLHRCVRAQRYAIGFPLLVPGLRQHGVGKVHADNFSVRSDFFLQQGEVSAGAAGDIDNGISGLPMG
jgi:hypothetical protein